MMRHQGWYEFNGEVMFAYGCDVFVLDLEKKVIEKIMVCLPRLLGKRWEVIVPYEMDLSEFFVSQLGGLLARRKSHFLLYSSRLPGAHPVSTADALAVDSLDFASLLPWVYIPSRRPPVRLDSSVDIASELAVIPRRMALMWCMRQPAMAMAARDVTESRNVKERDGTN
ncbi:hypothetical protein EJB05_16478, partial [Eragrostis curvula]